MDAAPAIPVHRIVTPEQVRFHYEVAGLVTRSAAWLADQLILWACYMAALFAAGALGAAIGLPLFFLCINLGEFAYFACFEYFRAGQTPGKRLMGIRVVTATGSRLRFIEVLLRNLLRPIDNLPIAMTLGGVAALCNRHHRRLGDFAADTLVIRDRRAALPSASGGPARRRQRVNTFAADAAIRRRILSRASREERDLIFDLAMRRDRLDPEHRQRLFARAADYFRRRYDLPQDLEHLSDEQTVLNLALVLRDARPPV